MVLQKRLFFFIKKFYLTDILEVLEKIFRVFDLNSDGVVTTDEMNKIIGVNIFYQTKFEVTNHGQDMYELLRNSNSTSLSQNDVLVSVFKEMDKNNDGKISCDEFVAACLGQEHISKMLAIKIIDIFIEDE